MEDDRFNGVVTWLSLILQHWPPHYRLSVFAPNRELTSSVSFTVTNVIGTMDTSLYRCRYLASQRLYRWVVLRCSLIHIRARVVGPMPFSWAMVRSCSRLCGSSRTFSPAERFLEKIGRAHV